MSNVRLTWQLPTVTPRHYPIDHVVVEFRVSDTLPWTVQDNVAADSAQEILFQDVAAGTNYYQVTVVDTNGTAGPPATAQAEIGFLPPDAVVNLVAAVE